MEGPCDVTENLSKEGGVNDVCFLVFLLSTPSLGKRGPSAKWSVLHKGFFMFGSRLQNPRTV